jgi:hypothetical protein
MLLNSNNGRKSEVCFRSTGVTCMLERFVATPLQQWMHVTGTL